MHIRPGFGLLILMFLMYQRLTYSPSFLIYQSNCVVTWSPYLTLDQQLTTYRSDRPFY